jgi:hypothetical protein
MNWLNIRESNRSNEEKKIQLIRRKLITVDNLRDYYVILKKLSEIDIFKKLFLTETQVKCFEYIEKPFNVNNMFGNNINENEEEKRKSIIRKFVSEFKGDQMNIAILNSLEGSVKNEIKTLLGLT